jgi:hypothetical protein
LIVVPGLCLIRNPIKYFVFLNPSIYVQASGFLRGPEVVHHLEASGLWQPARTIDGSTTFRQNSIIEAGMLYPTCPELLPLDAAIHQTFLSALAEYQKSNPHLQPRADEGYFFLRYRPGDHYPEHIDFSPWTGMKPRTLSGLLYLNSEFEGGALEFPRHGIVHQPQAGDLILFPSNFAYPHIAHPVTSGVRYVVVTWFH